MPYEVLELHYVYLEPSSKRMYRLRPMFHTTPGGRVWLEGVEMYDEDRVFLGTWLRSNMPYPLVVSITRFVRSNTLRRPVTGGRGE
jgi:hypothetical protein